MIQATQTTETGLGDGLRNTYQHLASASNMTEAILAKCGVPAPAAPSNVGQRDDLASLAERVLSLAEGIKRNLVEIAKLL